jgi:hypothetical protein
MKSNRFNKINYQLLFLFLLCGQSAAGIELEEDDVSVFHRVVPALLTVLAGSLKIKSNLIF